MSSSDALFPILEFDPSRIALIEPRRQGWTSSSIRTDLFWLAVEAATQLEDPPRPVQIPDA